MVVLRIETLLRADDTFGQEKTATGFLDRWRFLELFEGCEATLISGEGSGARMDGHHLCSISLYRVP
ncbi:hypothetical protein CGZ80_06940 [Rhodopirellula sp. MGV]|nr:hypothetical protein CGZ80_06940 [Rhodopirellula sp. MGV]